MNRLVDIRVTRDSDRLRHKDMRTVKVCLIALLGLLVAACGTDSGATTTSEPDATTTSTVETTTTLSPNSTTTQSPGSTSTTAGTTTTSTLAGDPIDFGPGEGDVLMVIGVAHDDVLNLRAGPGVGADIVGEIPPTYDELVALGDTRELSRSLWIAVDYDGVSGWVNLSYVGYQGSVNDETAQVVDDLGGYPTNATVTGLAEEVADVFVTEDEGGSEVVQVTPVREGDLYEVTYDVIGLADDSVRGIRLHIFAEESSNGFTLSNVEATAICGRGVDEDGLCV